MMSAEDRERLVKLRDWLSLHRWNDKIDALHAQWLIGLLGEPVDDGRKRDPLLADEKLFYQRFAALHHNADLVEIFKVFGYRVFRRSSVLEGFEAFIDKHQFRGRRCVEIGTCKGLTAVLLARRFDEVATLDIEPDPERGLIASAVGAFNIRFVNISGNVEKANLIRSLDFDAAYVDGDHARDTASDFRLVERCGNVLFHEYWPAQPAVMSLVDNLRAEGKVETEGKMALWTR